MFRFYFAHSFFELIDKGTTFKPFMKSTLTQVKDSLRIRTQDMYDNIESTMSDQLYASRPKLLPTVLNTYDAPF